MKTNSNPATIILLVAAGTFLGSCGGGDNGIQSWAPPPDANPGLPETVSVAPADTGDGWSVSSPTAESMDSPAVLGTLQSIRDGRFSGVDALVVVRHGRLAAEGYFNGYGPETLHDLRSTGKSFTSALAGIAIEQRLFALDDPIATLIPQFENHANMDARKRAITIRHLLDMRSGLECNDWSSASRGNEERMYNTRDWVGFILDLPMVNDPGAVASYCTGGVVVLGQVIAWRSGMALDAYAAAYLFAPLGIQQSTWRRSPDGSATGGGGLRLRPRDAARFGQLYLNGGVWNGARVVPADWVTRSRERVTTLGNDGYGLLWWKRSFAHRGVMVESFFTSGNGGNFIFVFPALDLIAVFTGSNYNSPMGDQPFDIVGNYILPAVR
ncbi:MAG TPA: serine hydrolase [Steroidobacteraceae bacterium]|nr:serine hydrolase [Steroidobacteraceae bacterium]